MRGWYRRTAGTCDGAREHQCTFVMSDSTQSQAPDSQDPYLQKLTRDLVRAPDLNAALATALDAAIAMLHADFGNIQLYRAGELTIAAQRGFKEPFLKTFWRVAADDDCACGRAMRSGRPIVIRDVTVDPEFTPFRPIAAEAGYRAVQSTPLVTSTGHFVGMLSTHFREPHAPRDDDMARLGAYAAVVADTIQRFVAGLLGG